MVSNHYFIIAKVAVLQAIHKTPGQIVKFLRGSRLRNINVVIGIGLHSHITEIIDRRSTCVIPIDIRLPKFDCIARQSYKITRRTCRWCHASVSISREDTTIASTHFKEQHFGIWISNQHGIAVECAYGSTHPAATIKLV